MTRRNALSCRSARRNHRPASTCLRLFLNHPKQPASYPLALCFERETSHNQVLTRTRAVCLQAASNLRFTLPATTKQPPAGTAAAISRRTLASSRRQPGRLTGTRRHDFSTRRHTCGICKHIFITRTHNNLTCGHNSQAAAGRPASTLQAAPTHGETACRMTIFNRTDTVFGTHAHTCA